MASNVIGTQPLLVFNIFTITILKAKYACVVSKIKKIFDQSNYDVNELIMNLSAADTENLTIFSTDECFSKITNTIQLFSWISKYCSMCDYELLLALVESTECEEAIRLLDNFSKELDHTILKDLNLMSEDGLLLDISRFIQGHKLEIQCVGGKLILKNLTLVRRIISNTFQLKTVSISFREYEGVDAAYQESTYQEDKKTAIAPQRAITDTKTALAHRRAIKGKHKANQFKIIMLGAEGAGKSCTVDSLLDNPFKHQPSTVGANIENTCTVGREFVTNWKPKQIHEQLIEVSRHYKCEVKERMIETMRDSETLLEQQEEQEKPPPEELTKAEEILQNKELPEGDIRVVIYDVGGQEVYYELQFLFLASLDVVFLAFDASKDLDDPVIRRYRYNSVQKVYKTRKAQTTLEAIEFALQTIHSRCGVKSDSGTLSYYTPTVILVATHSKKCKNKNGVTTKLKAYLMEKNLSRHLIKNNFLTYGIIFIDNEERDDPEYKVAILRLQEIAVKAACSAIDENRYISYLNFEVAILEQSCKFISWQDASIIAQNSGLEDDQEKLLQLLDFYTKRGILLYYPEVKALKDRVFISPQEVSDLVSTVIKIHEYTDDILLESDLNNKCIRFDKFGLLEEDLLDDILEKSGRAKDKHIILGFLEKFDLVVEVDSDTKFENEQSSYTLPENGRVFFVPAMLIYNETETYRPNPESVDNVVLYYFPDKYLPDIVFNHLLVSAIKWRKEYQYRIRRIFRGIGVFDFNNNKQSFTLQQCSETSCIKCYISVHQQEVNNMTLWSQREKLLLCLEESILQIHDSCISKSRKPIAYLDCPLRHNEQHEPHLVLKSITADAELFCRKNNAKIDESYYYLLVKLKNPPDPNTPTIQQLISQVRPEIAPKWYDLGVELLGEKYVKKLEVIGTDHKGNIEDCCTEMFKFWLRTDTKASWTKLVEALRSKSVQYDVLADEIEKKFVAASDAANDEALDSGTKIVPGGDKVTSREDDTREVEGSLVRQHAQYSIKQLLVFCIIIVVFVVCMYRFTNWPDIVSFVSFW